MGGAQAPTNSSVGGARAPTSDPQHHPTPDPINRLTRKLAFLPACLACGLAAFALWQTLGTPVALPEVPGGRLHCLSYTPFEPGARGTTTPGWVSDERIEADLQQLAALTSCLRLYTPLGNSPRVVAAAGRHGIGIWLGAWIGSDEAQNEREIAGALALARRHPGTVRLVVVGNEVLLRRELPAARLAALIGEVREASPVPVAYADVAHFIANSPEVGRAADVLLVHLLPYWDDPAPPQVADAARLVLQGFDEFRARFPGQWVAVGETGWPSAGRPRGPGQPGLVEQARFVREFAALAAARGIEYNLIEAIDQPWKMPAEGTVGGYWGILDEWREPKFALAGPVSAWPHWPAWAAATTALAVAMLSAALVGSGPGAAAWLGWTPLAFAGALALVFQWHQLALMRPTLPGWLPGIGAMILTAWAALLLLARLRGGAARVPGTLAGLGLGRALTHPATVWRSAALRDAAFVALTLLPVAWFGVVLTFAPRHRDLPVAFFVLPALALLFAVRDDGSVDRREEAVLAFVAGAGALAQVEPANPASLAWLAIGVLVVAAWRRALHAELLRIRRLFTDARQAQQHGHDG